MATEAGGPHHGRDAFGAEVQTIRLGTEAYGTGRLWFEQLVGEPVGFDVVVDLGQQAGSTGVGSRDRVDEVGAEVNGRAVHAEDTAGQPHTTIEGAGHFLQEDRGPELARVIVDFVRSTA